MLCFEKVRAQSNCLLCEGHPMRKVLISTGAFQGHQGNNKGEWRQSPLLSPRSIRPGSMLLCNCNYMYIKPGIDRSIKLCPFDQTQPMHNQKSDTIRYDMRAPDAWCAWQSCAEWHWRGSRVLARTCASWAEPNGLVYYIESSASVAPSLDLDAPSNIPIASSDFFKRGQAWYFTEATKAIASMPPSHCLGALEMLLWKFTISSSGCPLPRGNWLDALALLKTKQTQAWWEANLPSQRWKDSLGELRRFKECYWPIDNWAIM